MVRYGRQEMTNPSGGRERRPDDRRGPQGEQRFADVAGLRRMAAWIGRDGGYFETFRKALAALADRFTAGDAVGRFAASRDVRKP